MKNEQRTSQLMWDKVFTTENIDGLSDAQLCSIGCGAWGCCMMDGELPESFGKVMAMIAHKLKIKPTPEAFASYAKRFQ